jgi:hypothetical protein
MTAMTIDPAIVTISVLRTVCPSGSLTSADSVTSLATSMASRAVVCTPVISKSTTVPCSRGSNTTVATARGSAAEEQVDDRAAREDTRRRQDRDPERGEIQ